MKTACEACHYQLFQTPNSVSCFSCVLPSKLFSRPGRVFTRRFLRITLSWRIGNLSFIRPVPSSIYFSSFQIPYNPVSSFAARVQLYTQMNRRGKGFECFCISHMKIQSSFIANIFTDNINMECNAKKRRIGFNKYISRKVHKTMGRIEQQNLNL